MASALSSYVTAVELAQHDGQEGLLPLINMLSQRMDLFKVAHVMECNDGTGHEGIMEFSQPTGTWRAYNEGIVAHAPTSEPFREPTAMLDDYFKADLALLQHQKNGDAKRARMLGQFVAGMMKTFMTTIFYGDRSADGKRPNGVTLRSNWNTLSSGYVHDNAGGAASVTANKTSMYLIGFGEDKFSIIYPRNDAPGSLEGMPDPEIQGMGIRIKNLPDDMVRDSGGTNEFLAARNYCQCHFGICIADARYLQRICNISTSNIDGVDDFSFDEEYLIDALEAMPDLENAAIFGNHTLRAQIRKRCNEKGNIFHTADFPFGKNIPAVDNVPILVCGENDPSNYGSATAGGIRNTEATVT